MIRPFFCSLCSVAQDKLINITYSLSFIRNRGLIHCNSSDFHNCKLSSLLYGEESKIFLNCFNIIQHFGDHLKINDPDDGDNGDNIDYLV